MHMLCFRTAGHRSLCTQSPEGMQNQKATTDSSQQLSPDLPFDACIEHEAALVSCKNIVREIHGSIAQRLAATCRTKDGLVCHTEAIIERTANASSPLLAGPDPLIAHDVQFNAIAAEALKTIHGLRAQLKAFAEEKDALRKALNTIKTIISGNTVLAAAFNDAIIKSCSDQTELLSNSCSLLDAARTAIGLPILLPKEGTSNDVELIYSPEEHQEEPEPPSYEENNSQTSSTPRSAPNEHENNSSAANRDGNEQDKRRVIIESSIDPTITALLKSCAKRFAANAKPTAPRSSYNRSTLFKRASFGTASSRISKVIASKFARKIGAEKQSSDRTHHEHGRARQSCPAVGNSKSTRHHRSDDNSSLESSSHASSSTTKSHNYRDKRTSNSPPATQNTSKRCRSGTADTIARDTSTEFRSKKPRSSPSAPSSRPVKLKQSISPLKRKAQAYDRALMNMPPDAGQQFAIDVFMGAAVPYYLSNEALLRKHIAVAYFETGQKTVHNIGKFSGCLYNLLCNSISLFESFVLVADFAFMNYWVCCGGAERVVNIQVDRWLRIILVDLSHCHGDGDRGLCRADVDRCLNQCFADCTTKFNRAASADLKSDALCSEVSTQLPLVSYCKHWLLVSGSTQMTFQKSAKATKLSCFFKSGRGMSIRACHIRS